MRVVFNNEKQRTGGSWLTLCAHQHHGHLCCVPVAGQAQEVVIDRLETNLVLQTENEHHSIHPGGKLSTQISKHKIYLQTSSRSCIHLINHVQFQPSNISFMTAEITFFLTTVLACEGAFPKVRGHSKREIRIMFTQPVVLLVCEHNRRTANHSLSY